MAISNGYITLALVKTSLGITGTGSDTQIERAVEAVSRSIERFTGRTFYSTGTSARYYTATDWDYLVVDDIGSSGGFAVSTDPDGDRTYDVAWTTSGTSADVDLWPYNGAPYLELRTTPGGDYQFPKGVAQGVKVVARFGYQSGTSAQAPADVQQAALIQSVRIFKRQDAPFGVAGPNAFGQATILADLDADVKMLLTPFKRLVWPR